MLLMKGDRFVDVAVNHAITIGGQKSVGIDIRQCPFNTAAGHRFGTGIEERHSPIFLGVMAELRDRGFGPEPHRDITRVPVVVSEIFFDNFASITETENEVLVPVVGIILHDVPKNRATADRDHRLRTEFGFFTQTCPEAAAQNNYFHGGLIFGG